MLFKKKEINIYIREKKMSVIIAVPSNERMRTHALAYLANSGIQAVFVERKLYLETSIPSVRVLLLDYKDIPRVVGKNEAQIGITTNAALSEYPSAAKLERDLGFSKCRMAFAAQTPVMSLLGWNGQRIVTPYPNLAQTFASANGLMGVRIQKIHGAAEGYVAAGLADGIIDIVQTGETLTVNGLVEGPKVMDVHAVLISQPETRNDGTFLHVVNALQLGA